MLPTDWPTDLLPGVGAKDANASKKKWCNSWYLRIWMPRPLSGGQFQIPSLFRCKLRQSNCSHWTTFHFHFLYYMFLYLNCTTTHTTLQCTQFKHNLLYDVLQMQSICNFLQCRAFLTRISGDISRPSGSSFWFKYICNLSGIFILITRTVILASVLYMIV